jgi:two-component system, LytTR family, response regulator
MPSPTGAIRALIVDDEPPARRRIRALLQAESDFAAVEECRDGREAIRAIEETAPDLVFLDVQMPEANGFDVVAAVGPDRMPPVIFVTAYDEFALRAFEVHALDYLLKPFDRERFEQALQRARAQIAQRRSGELDARLRRLLSDVQPAPRYTRRILARSGTRHVFVPVEDIAWIEAADNYVYLHTGQESYRIRGPMSAVEASLDPEQFVRVHRSAIVNILHIKEMEPVFKGEYLIRLHTGARVSSSRTYTERLRNACGL